MSLEMKHLMEQPLTTYSPTSEIIESNNNWFIHCYVCYSMGE